MTNDTPSFAQRQSLCEALLVFEEFINEPPQYEDQRMVRDYRHELYRKWSPLRDLVTAALAPGNGAVEAEPVAWRWKLPPTGDWTYSKHRPAGLLVEVGYITQPLYATPSPAVLDTVTVERCAKAAEQFHVPPYTVADCAQNIAAAIRALIGHPASNGEPVTSTDGIEGIPGDIRTDSESNASAFGNSPKEIKKRAMKAMSPLTQTESAQPFTQCSECWQPATCKKYGCRVPQTDKVKS